MMSLLQETKLLLRTYRISPKKSLGQNFLVEERFLQEIVEHACLNSGDDVLEIGAGLGFLTRLLGGQCKSVTAVEIDPGLVEILREQLREFSNIRIIHGSVFHSNLPSFDKIVSIPPYQISSNLLVWMFDKVSTSADMILQKEFANRLVAPVGSEQYGWLTVMTHYYAETEVLNLVPKASFYPQPKVDSVIVRLTNKNTASSPLANKKLLQQLLRSFFTERNQKVKNAARTYVKNFTSLSQQDANAILKNLPFFEKRVRELMPNDFGVLAVALNQ
jgi:16S rRNA (adenine1518-N6/adenine1519-N6)-dimethyltransferase